MSNKEFRDIKCNFNLYKSFYAVAITGSLSEAARALSVSQPALSYTIKQLEEQLDTTLFYRKAKGVSLTKIGEKVFKYVEVAYNSILRAEDEVKYISKNINNSIIIGCPSHIVNFYLLDKVELFMNENPDISIKLVEKGTQALKKLLDEREIDVIIDVGIELEEKDNYVCKPIKYEEFCFVGNNEIMKRCSKIEDLEKVSLILPASGGQTRRICDEFLNKNNIKVIPKIEAYTTETMKKLVKKGMGVGFFFASSIEEELEKGIFVKLETKCKTSNLQLSYVYTEKNHLLERFIECVYK